MHIGSSFNVNNPPTRTSSVQAGPCAHWAHEVQEIFKKLHLDLTLKLFNNNYLKAFTTSHRLILTPIENLAKKYLINCQSINPCTELQADPALRFKRLENGFTYYVRQNDFPVPEKAYLSLIVRVGHLNETEEERGVAHLIEHIAQTETESYKKGEIKTYYDSKGVMWGNDNNATTSTHDTTYKITVPLSDPEILEKSIQILYEVAAKATLSNALIEGEKEIIIDELRLGRTVKSRYLTCLWPKLLEGTRFSEILNREKEIQNIRKCTPDLVRNFYKKWYQPQNMALTCVGDFDAQEVSDLIEKYFSPLKAAQVSYNMDTQQTLTPLNESKFICFSDPEVAVSQLEIFFRLPQTFLRHPMKTSELRTKIARLFFYDILENRLVEKAASHKASFTKASSSESMLVHGWPSLRIVANVNEGEILKAFKELLYEVNRIKKFGISENELHFSKEKFAIEEDEDQKELSSKELMAFYKSHFIYKAPMPSPPLLKHLKKHLIKRISLDEVNAISQEILQNKNCVVGTIEPQKDGFTPVTEGDLKKVMEEAKQEQMSPYVFQSIDRPLLESMPESGKIVQTRVYEKTDVTEFILQNGLKVFFKPTTFEGDRIKILGYSVRGERDVEPENRISAKFSENFFNECGLGTFSLHEIEKLLNGKNIALAIEIEKYLTTQNISCAKKDLETSFQLLHLMFMNQCLTKESYEIALAKEKEALRNRQNQPITILNDKLRELNTQNHPEYRAMKLEDLKEINFEVSKEFLTQLFSNPADYIFTVVGNIEESNLKEWIEKYLGSVPKKREKRARYDYSPVPFPSGIIRQQVEAGKETACMCVVTFPAPIEDDYYERIFSKFCCDLVQQRLIKILRLKLGQVYIPVCTFLNTPIPGLNPSTPSKSLVLFTCDKDNLQPLEKALISELQRLQEEGPDEQEINELKKVALNDYTESFNSNYGWLNAIVKASLWNRGIDQIGIPHDELDRINIETTKQHLKKIFPTHNYTLVSLVEKPETKEVFEEQEDHN